MAKRPDIAPGHRKLVEVNGCAAVVFNLTCRAFMRNLCCVAALSGASPKLCPTNRMELDMHSAASNLFRARLAGLTLCAALFAAVASTAARADDARCEQLVALHRQYAGVALTGEQQGLKRKLVAWYNSNCGGVRRSAGR